PLAGAVPREERLEDVLQYLRRHATAGIGDNQLRQAVACLQVDRDASALVHAVQGIDDEIEHHRLDPFDTDPGKHRHGVPEDDVLAAAIGQMLGNVKDGLDKLGEISALALALTAAAELKQPFGDALAAERLLLDHFQILGEDRLVIFDF